MGKRENLDQEVLGQMGTVSELTLDEVFGY